MDRLFWPDPHFMEVPGPKEPWVLDLRARVETALDAAIVPIRVSLVLDGSRRHDTIHPACPLASQRCTSRLPSKTLQQYMLFEVFSHRHSNTTNAILKDERDGHTGLRAIKAVVPARIRQPCLFKPVGTRERRGAWDMGGVVLFYLAGGNPRTKEGAPREINCSMGVGGQRCLRVLAM